MCAICGGTETPRCHYILRLDFFKSNGLTRYGKGRLIYHLAAVVGVGVVAADHYETLKVKVNGTQTF